MTPPDTRYELLFRIAAGGMGEVHLATDKLGPPPGRRVALKLLLPHLSEEREFIEMFLDEARLSARLHHPHIPQVLDVGLAEGRYFLAIELIEGVSASQLLKGCRRAGAMLPLPVVRLCARGLCEALEYAHDLKDATGRALEVVHRDVSPSNLLLSTSGQVFLNDFGIARALDRSHSTRTGEVKGKFAYMPPEQLDLSAPVDRRADVYSAALTLFELATLQSPFLRQTEPATIDAVRTDTLPEITLTRNDVTPQFRAALVRATSRRPGDRFPTARALLDALMDGPVAAPAELGQLVESLCPEELEVFRRKASDALTRAGMETASMLRPERRTALSNDPGTAAEIAELRKRTPNRWAPFGLAALLATGLAGWVVLGPSAPPALAPTPAPIAAAEPKPPVPVPPVSSPEPARAEPAPKRVRPTPPPVAVKPVPATGPGWVSIDARPWANVFIDGKEIDRTPIARYPLPPGRYTLVFKNPERNQEQTRVVTIESGRSSSVLVDLP